MGWTSINLTIRFYHEDETLDEATAQEWAEDQIDDYIEVNGTDYTVSVEEN